MQKIEEWDSSCFEESVDSSTVVKKNVHFSKSQEKDGDQLNELNNQGTLDSIHSETESGTLPEINTTNNHAKVKRRYNNKKSINSKYLVCFKSSNRKDRAIDLTDHNNKDNINSSENSIATSNVNYISSFDDEQRNKKTSKSKVNIHLNRTQAEPLISQINNSYELNKVSNQRYGFRTHVLRIFRQFNLKNQCCCK